MKKIRVLLNFWKIIFLYPFVYNFVNNNLKTISLDYKLNKCLNMGDFSKINYGVLIILNRRYRSVLYERLRHFNIDDAVITLCNILLPKLKTVEFVVDNFMGDGIKISHNSVVIHAKEIGNNVSFGPFVVVGKNQHGERPTILNNVTINANATVIGNILLENVIVGAGSVVNHSFSNSIVAGVPAKSIKKIEEY